MVSGCAAGPNFVRPAPPHSGEGYVVTESTNISIGEVPDRQWWKGFASPELDHLVEQALANNASLAASRETLARSLQRARAYAGRQLPQMDAHTKAQHEQINISAIGIGDVLGSQGFPAISNPEFDLYSLGGGVTFDLDLFGANRRATEQARAEAEAQARQTEAAHLLIAGRVVLQAVTIAALNERLATDRGLIADEERISSITRRRVQAGLGARMEVLSAEGQLATRKAELPMHEQELAEARAQLAVLLGISPLELGATDWTLDTFALPGKVPVALPSSMVHSRPDILEAEARLHAATAAIGVAKAHLYPNVTLGATLDQASSDVGMLTSSQVRGFDIFAGLTAPIFHGGTLRAEKRGAEASARAAAAAYRQVVLDAFAQVTGLLSAMSTDARALEAERMAAGSTGETLALSQRSYEAGLTGITSVLDASRANRRAHYGLLDARARQLANMARLLAATGGGWTGADETSGNGKAAR